MDVTWICENYGDWSEDPDLNPHTMVEVMGASVQELESIQRVLDGMDPQCTCEGSLIRTVSDPAEA